ncbi:MAG: TetR/AcrR family transcriptional regulator [Acidimicrobiia bacterium]|nr:TetR/AcrR family transcriptional regulator [Acidimicrobiia bacterium]
MSVAAAAAGRPRSVEADVAILESAIGLFCELGYDGLSMERVAVDAGVSKTTIYRRYPTKLDLVMAAIHQLPDGIVPAPDTGNLRSDLLAISQGLLTMLTKSTVGKAIPVTLAAKTRNPELAEAHEAFVRSRREITTGVIQRGIDRGELSADADPWIVSDLITGAIFMRVFVTGQPVTREYLEAMIDQVIGV